MFLFCSLLSTPKGPIPMFAVPPAMAAFSNTVTLTPSSAAATDAQSPAGPAAMIATSVFIFVIMLTSYLYF